jgi:type VI secretion system protein ImpC
MPEKQMTENGDKKSGGIQSFGIGFGRPGEEGRPREVSDRGPLRIVVLSELTPRADYATGPAPHLEAIPIDKLSFDRVMEALAPSLAIEVKDPFVPTDPPLRVDLRWRELKALRPDAIVEQVPLLRALVDARRVVEDVRGRRLSAANARAQLARILPRPSWAESLTSEVTERAGIEGGDRGGRSPPVGGSSPLDDLLDKVDIKGPESARAAVGPPAGNLSAIVTAIAKSARGNESVPAAVVGSAPERVERAFARIVGDVLRHPEVRRLERAWRSLRLLVDACDFRAGVEVDAVPTDAEGVERAFRRLADRAGGESSRAPVDLFVIDHDVAATAVDLARLEKWGEMAEAFRAPLVTNGTAGLLGVDDLAQIAKTTRRLANIDDPRSVAVRGVASRDAARWIALAFNHVLLRSPYTASTSRVRDLPFAEDAADRDACVFGGAAIVVAGLSARSFVKHGWPTAIVGPQNGVFGNLPVHEVADAGQTFAIPLETFVTTDAQTEAARAGFTLLGCAANHDAAVLMKAPVLYRGPTVGGGADNPAGSTLGDQLFVGRLANAIEQLAAAIPNNADPKAIEETARVMLSELFANAAPSGPEIEVAVDTVRQLMQVTVRPRRYAGVSLEEVTLGAQLA